MQRDKIPMLRHPSILLQDDCRQTYILQMLVDAGAELTSCDLKGYMQVSDVLRYGKRKLVRIILHSNMDLCAKYERKTALHYLAQNKNEGIVEELHMKQIVINMSGSYESLPVSYAVNCVNPRMVEFFFKSKSVISNVHFAFLLRACSEELTEEIVEVIAILLKYKVDPLKDLSGIIFYYQPKSENSAVKPWPIVQQVVAHFSAQEQFEKLNDQTSTFIDSNQDIKDYYKSCKKQLEEIKTNTICQSVTLFELVVANENKIMAFASNKKLVLKLEDMTQLRSGNKFYDRIIQKHVAMILKIAEYREKVITSVCTSIGKLYEWNDIVSEKIVSFLSYEQLESLFLLSSD